MILPLVNVLVLLITSKLPKTLLVNAISLILARMAAPKTPILVLVSVSPTGLGSIVIRVLSAQTAVMEVHSTQLPVNARTVLLITYFPTTMILAIATSTVILNLLLPIAPVLVMTSTVVIIVRVALWSANITVVWTTQRANVTALATGFQMIVPNAN